MTAPIPHMPDTATLERLRKESPEGPVVMLNLLKYRQPGGREAFGRYGQITGKLIAEAEGQLVLGGSAGVVLTGSDVAWDDVLVVRFPSVDHFLGMIESRAYQEEAAPIRAEALEATVWMAIHPFDAFR
ncbi:MAG: DUF1330 domain-containing protein [Myxococcota bacterium]